MAYNDNETFDTMAGLASTACRDLISILNTGVIRFDKWQSFKNGRTSAQLVADLGKTEADWDALTNAFEALDAIKSYADNTTPVQHDYISDMEKFS